MRWVAVQINGLPTLGTLRPLSSHADSEECVKLIRECVKQCTYTHPRCQPIPFRDLPSRPALPKRVLRIGSDDTDGVKLVEPKGIRGKYITLSHCWGGHQPLKTTKANISQMKQSINWESLPATFQDAIRVARRVGVGSLWIDSLCIIQDSKEDWEIESAKMCDYYENAYFTISASSSPNSTISFLKERDRSWQPVSFEFQDRDGTLSTVHARRLQGNVWEKDPRAFGPTMSRGWILQEHVLSPRLLHYTEAELIWECRSERVSEDGSESDGMRFTLGLNQKILECRENPHHYWRELVESYTLRFLTFETDKLPAISGVASKVLEFLPSRPKYLAGLWQDNLAEDLCWYTFNPSFEYSTSLKQFPQKYRAPSWSWASVNGGVTFHFIDDDIQNLITVADAHCTVPGVNPFGEVTDGSITLTGPLFQAFLDVENNPQHGSSYKLHLEGDRTILAAPDIWLYPDGILVETKVSTLDGLIERTVRRSRQDDSLSPIVDCPVTCLHVGTAQKPETEDYAILLGRSDTIVGAYIRLGLIAYRKNKFVITQHTKVATINII